MIRKTAFLVTGTVTGLVAVLGYNPPNLNNAIAASGNTPIADPTTSTTNSDTSNSPAQPAPSTSATKATTSTKKSSTSTKSTNTSTRSNSAASESTNSSSTTASNTETQSNPTPTPTQTKQSSGSSGTFKGDTAQTRWGPVQVQITVSNGKITDISTLQYPNGDRRSLMISQQVIPWLQQEALRVQTANISGIGGATYTSTGFRNSLASALQKAGI